MFVRRIKLAAPVVYVSFVGSNLGSRFYVSFYTVNRMPTFDRGDYAYTDILVYDVGASYECIRLGEVMTALDALYEKI